MNDKLTRERVRALLDEGERGRREMEQRRREMERQEPDLDNDMMAHALNIAARERDTALAEVERLRREAGVHPSSLTDVVTALEAERDEAQAEAKKLREQYHAAAELTRRQVAARSAMQDERDEALAEAKRLRSLLDSEVAAYAECAKQRDAARLQADEWKRYAEALSFGDPVCGRCGVAVPDEPASAPLCDLCSGGADDEAE